MAAFLSGLLPRGTKRVPITMTYGRYNTYRFVKHIEETMGVKILQSIKASGRGYTPTKEYFTD
jgi:hypothetical protein